MVPYEPSLANVFGRPGIACGLGAVRAVVGEHGVDPVGNRRGERSEEVGCNPARGLLLEIREGELRGSVDGNEEVELALSVRTSATSMWR